MDPKAEAYTFNQVKELLQMRENMLLNVLLYMLLTALQIDWARKLIF